MGRSGLLPHASQREVSRLQRVHDYQSSIKPDTRPMSATTTICSRPHHHHAHQRSTISSSSPSVPMLDAPDPIPHLSCSVTRLRHVAHVGSSSCPPLAPAPLPNTTCHAAPGPAPHVPCAHTACPHAASFGRRDWQHGERLHIRRLRLSACARVLPWRDWRQARLHPAALPRPALQRGVVRTHAGWRAHGRAPPSQDGALTVATDDGELVRDL